MLFAASGLIGCPVAASDGRIGAVEDFLLDGKRWAVRWMVVDTGEWLPGRKVLIHPSAIAPIQLPPRPAFPMLTFGGEMAVSVNLTVRQVEASPDARKDEPVSAEMEQRLLDHYGWDPFWSALELGAEAIDGRLPPPPIPTTSEDVAATSDPNLGSAARLKEFSAYGSDGEIGAVDNVFIDDVSWAVRYLVVATRGWLRGKLVQIPLSAGAAVDWRAETVSLPVTRERVDSAPAFDPVALVDAIAEERLHGHFGAPPLRR
jgi:hypothetical protein